MNAFIVAHVTGGSSKGLLRGSGVVNGRYPFKHYTTFEDRQQMAGCVW